jgi:hypothetical protein
MSDAIYGRIASERTYDIEEQPTGWLGAVSADERK